MKAHIRKTDVIMRQTLRKTER